MNIFKNKFFLLGNLAFLLITIPVVLFFIRNQTSTRGSAAPTTTLSFINPSLNPNQCDETQRSRLVLNPGQNEVATIKLYLKWDKTKFDIEFTPNQTAFPQVASGPTNTADGMSVELNIGGDITKAITTTTDVGTITIKPSAPTDGATSLTIDPNLTQVFSLASQDGESENVYNAAGSSPLQVTISAQACTDSGITPSVTTTVTPTATVTTAPSITTSPTVTATPTTTSAPTATPTLAAANQSPVCQSITPSTITGAAPLAVTFTASGSDADGTLTKATFNFGNGTQQDVTTGLGTATGSAQISHTYTTGGTFTATAVFTDNRGAVSLACSRQITVTGGTTTTPTVIAPTATPTLAPIVTNPPTATPTIAPSGNIGMTAGIIGGIVLVLIAGIFLLAL